MGISTETPDSGIISASHLSSLPLGAIVARCSEEIGKYRRHEPYDDTPAYELFRRAIVARDDGAWSALHTLYHGLVLSWLRHHPAWCPREDDGNRAAMAWQRFWLHISADRFANFPSVASLLRYLKLCCHSVLTDEGRKCDARHPGARGSGWEECATIPDASETIIDDLTTQEFWQAVMQTTSSEAERVIMRCTFVLLMKPGAIYAQHGALFDSVADVYRIKRNLLDRLQRDPAIKGFRR